MPPLLGSIAAFVYQLSFEMDIRRFQVAGIVALVSALVAVAVAVDPLNGADLPGAPSATNRPPATSVVWLIQDSEATEAFRARPERVRAMVERGLTNLTGKADAPQAWRSLLSTQDVVGIKVFSAPGLVGTRPEVVGALAETLLAAGVPGNHIVIWDRFTADLQAAGFLQLAKDLGVRVASSHQSGYDDAVAYTNYFLGHLTWSDVEFNQTGDQVGKRSFFTKLVTKELTKIVNVAPMLNNYRSGVVGCLYSLAIGSVDNTQRFESGAERMAEAVPEIYAQESLADKVVLNVVDALIAQYEGESQTMLHYAAAVNELRFSKDPVALDVLSLRELELLRQTNNAYAGTNFSVSFQKLYRENATLLELGNADPQRIRVERR